MNRSNRVFLLRRSNVEVEVELGQSANDDAPQKQKQKKDDPHVTRALNAMKADPSRRWTVALLARIGGLSRAAFARRFTQAVGLSPLRWLTAYRLGLAEKSLLESDCTLTNIASQIGYQSEFAFAKAFKRKFGIAPGFYRHRLRAGAIVCCLAA